MNKSILTAAVAAVLMVACSSPSRIVSSWRDPETQIKNPAVHKLVVAAVIYDPTVRRQVEDYMASLFPGCATASYQIFGAKPLDGNEEKYSQQLKDQGYDGILIVRRTNETVSQHYVPGQMPSWYTTWGGYWQHSWAVSHYSPGTPGHMSTNRTWITQVSVFSLNDNKLIWSAITSTTNPGGSVPLFKDVCDAARKQMKKDRFLN